MLLFGIIVGSCLLWLVGESGVVIARSEVDGLGGRTAPAVASALRLHAYLADADRLAANDFLLGSPASNEKRQEYELDMASATRELEQAAELNQAGGGQAGEQLQQLGALIVQYAGLVETARANLHPPSPAAVMYLRQATALMHHPVDGILARVDALAAADAADRAMDQTRLQALTATAAAFFAIARLLLGWLIYAQAFLRRRFRRRFSPPVLGAVFVLVALSTWMALQSASTYRDLSRADGVAFTELQRLSLMKSLVADANAEESLALIARDDGGLLQNEFNVTTEKLVKPSLTADMADAAARGDVRFSGLLADELRAASSPSDRAGTVRVLRSYEEFLAVDGAFRARAMAGRYDEATALVVGSTQLGTAFADLNIALEQRVEVEQARFDSTVAAARPRLRTDIGIALGAIAIALLVIQALRPRLAEYTGTNAFERREGRGSFPPRLWERRLARPDRVARTGRIR